MKNKNIMFAAVLLFAVALSLVPTVNASGHFATNYTNASLTGVYGYSSYGEHLGPSNPNNNTTNVPADSVGVLWFDGLGTFEFHDTADLGGFIIQRGTADNHTRAFVIVDGAMELQLGAADGLDVSRGVAKKQ